MTHPRCPRCEAPINTDFGHEADHYEMSCPECGHPLVVFRMVSVNWFATTDIRKVRPSSTHEAMARLMKEMQK